jgi:lysophospholipase L1-like esterase
MRGPRLVLTVAVSCLAAVAACGGDDVVVSTTSTTAAESTTTTDRARPPIRYLALGDSYTIGESVEEPERWPNQLARELEAVGFPSVDVEIVARTGWTTSELDDGIDRAEPVGPYDLVSLLIGVNNQFRGLDLEQYRTEFIALLERAVDFSSGPVFVVSIPDWGVTPFGQRYDPATIAVDIDRFNDVAREEAAARGVPFIDITPTSRSGDPSLVAADGLHPSGAQYSEWVELIRPVVLDLLD